MSPTLAPDLDSQGAYIGFSALTARIEERRIDHQPAVRYADAKAPTRKEILSTPGAQNP